MRLLQEQKAPLLKGRLFLYSALTVCSVISEGFKQTWAGNVRLRPMAHAFSTVLPKDVYFTSIKRKDNDIILLGRSLTNTHVSDLMRNITTSPYIQQPLLKLIKHKGENKTFQREFELHLTNAKEKNPTEQKKIS